MVDYKFYRELYYKEHRILRNELNNLKNCQVTFLTFSVTATGLLFGFVATLSPDYKILYLAPLIILLPAWSIFFDKAKTISRIVGYYRILEGLILNKCIAKNFVGWENALQIFRDKEPEERKIKKEVAKKLCSQDTCQFSFFLKNIFLRPFRRYWVLVYNTFFYLSLSCTIPAIVLRSHFNEIIVVVVALIIIGIVSYVNLRTVYELFCGNHHYEANECFWRSILKVEEYKSLLSNAV